jgi:hypothetical protein
VKELEKLRCMDAPAAHISAQEELVRVLEEAVGTYEHHRDLVRRSKEGFANTVNSLSPGEFLVIMDYKENIKLRCGNIEDPSDFYEQQRRTLFGMVVTTRKKNGRLVTLYVDVLSKCLTHDSLVTTSIMRYLEAQNIFGGMLERNVTLKGLSVYSDNCTAQFRNKTALGFWAAFKTANPTVPVAVNYFVEYHGKSRYADISLSLCRVPLCLAQWNVLTV